MNNISASINRSPIKRLDYQPPAWLVQETRLHIRFDGDVVEVESWLKLSHAAGKGGQIFLNGEGLELLQLTVDGKAQPAYQYQPETGLTIDDAPAHFTLYTKVKLSPRENKSLEGLYFSGTVFCTQCEAEGFRHITFYPDRPDILAPFYVRLEARKDHCPILLSNGNRVQAGDLADGWHFVEWYDPFPKPCYLFAVVAGDLAVLRDQFTTMSGRVVELGIWVEARDVPFCDYAMQSLKLAMRWDEERYGREYGLDIFNIVAVADFNMGAMENTGLNIFNTAYILADPATVTDADLQGIAAVVAHEFFHHWTGNLVTLRDWFQLTLKEGLTVFRDQQFSDEVFSPGLNRITAVDVLRRRQFPEDAGPTSHPIRPDEYLEINNFYTPTVYEKGAEFCRMLWKHLGEVKFRAGMDEYFRRHQGQAVTCDDFVAALAAGSGENLDIWLRWYGQAGTPQLRLEHDYDAAGKKLTISLSQSVKNMRQPLPIPVTLSLRGANGQALSFIDQQQTLTESTLLLQQEKQQFVVEGVNEKPVLSVLRGFSAPVRLEMAATASDYRLLMAHDNDPFIRWDSMQTLASRALLQQISTILEGKPPQPNEDLLQGVAGMLAQAQDLPPAKAGMVARLLTLPDESIISPLMASIHVEALTNSLFFTREYLGKNFASPLLALYQRFLPLEGAVFDNQAFGGRALINASLRLLLAGGAAEFLSLAERQYQHASTMNCKIAALQFLCDYKGAEADAALADFYHHYHHQSLALDKWFAVQAKSQHQGALAAIEKLRQHPDFNIKNPNRLRSLISHFTAGNHRYFHDISGRGYQLLAEIILQVDGFNPQMAARLTSGFRQWQRYDAERQQLMGACLRDLAAQKLSPDLQEMLTQILG